jgi:hypothetical protein
LHIVVRFSDQCSALGGPVKARPEFKRPELHRSASVSGQSVHIVVRFSDQCSALGGPVKARPEFERPEMHRSDSVGSDEGSKFKSILEVPVFACRWLKLKLDITTGRASMPEQI